MESNNFFIFSDCLPLSIILGSLLERGVVLDEPQFLHGKKLVGIHSLNKKVQKEACDTLRAEFESLKQKYVQLRYQKESNFQTLALYSPNIIK